MSSRPVPRQRRHTLLFLEEVRSAAPVFLDTEVDMTRVQELRAEARARGRRYSVPACVVKAAGLALARHPAANSAIRGRLRPRIRTYPAVHAKLALDKRLADERVVLAAVLPDVDSASLADIQRQVELARDRDGDSAPEFAPVRLLQRLPWPVRPIAYRTSVRPLGRRPSVLGTVAVTSLGHRAVDGFHSVGGTTVTLGVGRVLDRPVVRGGHVVVAPVMRLSLAFDHRVIDGAEAADVLSEIKEELESCAGWGEEHRREGEGGTP